jgi:hypothetical protein
VILAVVDDVQLINYDFKGNCLDTLTTSDVIITDAWFNRPLSAQILCLPKSWFGIYAYRPEEICSKPGYNFGLSINRVDYNRMMIFLEFGAKGHINSRSLINFNCARHTDSVDTMDHNHLWQQNWNNLDEFYQQQYQTVYDRFRDKMPWRNHEHSIDEVMQQALVNVIVETYTGDHSVALSEKIFRALVTPRPWVSLSGTWTVARLRSLGFDTLDNVVDHQDIDGLKMIEDKIPRVVSLCHKTWTKLKWSDIQHRCHAAAKNNQDLLQEFRINWPRDFSKWWARATEIL